MATSQSLVGAPMEWQPHFSADCGLIEALLVHEKLAPVIEFQAYKIMSNSRRRKWKTLCVKVLIQQLRNLTAKRSYKTQSIERSHADYHTDYKTIHHNDVTQTCIRNYGEN